MITKSENTSYLVIDSVFNRREQILKSKMSAGLIDYKTYALIKTELQEVKKQLEKDIKE